MVGRDDQQECLLEDLTGSYSGEPEVIPIVGMGGIVDDTVKMKGEPELEDMLQKSLKGKRYLIILDVIWSCEVWDGVRRCFPTEDNAGSRILLTTRNDEVAGYAGTENLSLQMDFMDQDESWNLFKRVAFSSEELSSDLETIGKQIAEKCHGLPLTIVVVAGLLKFKREIEDWESVAKDVKSFVINDPDDQYSQDREIPVKNLMRAWMDEGFLKLEGVDEKCLEELVDRCLVLVCKKSLDGTKIRSCKDAYLYILKSELIHFKLVKVLEFRNMEIDNSPVQILSLIWLGYLALLCRKKVDIPPEICRLWNLQTFIVKVKALGFFKLANCFLLVSTLLHEGGYYGTQNVKELGICGYYETDSNSIRDTGLLNNLVHLQQLETLSFILCFNLLPAIAKALPATLKKLKLEGTFLSWSYLDIIAELPNLEVLKLMWLDHIIMMMMMMKKNNKKKKIQMLMLQDDDDDDSDVDVAKYDDDDVDVAEDDDNEDSDADAAKHDDNYDLNWLFDVQNNLALLTPVHRQLRDHDNNHLLKRTNSNFSFGLYDSIYSVLKSELIHIKLLNVLELRHIEIETSGF
ncbi:hypothetical protein CQW23_06472 [Capsicum baccatum]|uniref:NB-ARC domain-containing protein n=1 Tax=Capsicum baccatum TaxID=33114 RepID=A0A2G2X3H9_CAPBA|nr:hypothetical protein CQW23_06472 [Capsicum baccatum]